MIELAILGLLDEQELHGYELRKRVAAVLGPLRGGLSFGSLYPALNRLERDGLVKAVDAEGPASLPGWSSGSLAGELAAFRARLTRPGRARGGRGRKVYGITESGRARLVALLTEPGPIDERTFALRVAFCTMLSPAERLELFERRRQELEARLSQLQPGGVGGREGHRYVRSLREHDIETIHCDLDWLDRLIAGEREQAPPKEEPTR